MHYRSVVHVQVLAAVATVVAAFSWSLQTSAVPLPAVRVEVLAVYAKWLAIPLVLAIFLVMVKRGRSAELIKGAAGNVGNPGLPAALLSNTVEQTGLAVLSLAAFSVASPQDLGAVAQAFVGLYCAGRAFFFVGYAINPMWRFYGFSLNFYSSLFLLALAWWLSISDA